MRRAPTPMSATLALLAACSGPSATTMRPTPSGPVADVPAQVAVAGRAIQAGPNGFVASLPAVGPSARFDHGGVAILGEDGGETLRLRTARWGRAGALRDVPLANPELGACTPLSGVDGACVRRLEYSSPGLTEWWIGEEAGVEQGWELAEPPGGVGELIFEVEVDRAAVAGGGMAPRSRAPTGASGRWAGWRRGTHGANGWPCRSRPRGGS